MGLKVPLKGENTDCHLMSPELEQFFLVQLAYIQARHGFTQALGSGKNGLWIVVMGRGHYDGLRARRGIGGFEDPRTDEDRLCAQVSDQRRIRGRGDTAG